MLGRERNLGKKFQKYSHRFLPALPTDLAYAAFPILEVEETGFGKKMQSRRYWCLWLCISLCSSQMYKYFRKPLEILLAREILVSLQPNKHAQSFTSRQNITVIMIVLQKHFGKLFLQ